MKNVYAFAGGFVVAALLFLAGLVVGRYAQPQLVALPEVSPDFTIEYFQDGVTYELACDPVTGEVILKHDLFLDVSPPVDQLGMLRLEAVRLISSSEPVPLGKTGISFVFGGGYPIWEPYEQVADVYHKQCLRFAQGAIIQNGIIGAVGLETNAYPEFNTAKSNN